MKLILSLITLILALQSGYTASVILKMLPLPIEKEYQQTEIRCRQDTFPIVQKQEIDQNIVNPSPLKGRSYLKDKYNRFENPIYTFFNDSIIGNIGQNFVSESIVHGFRGQKYLTEEGFDSIEEELVNMIEEGLQEKLLPYCTHFAKRTGMPLTGPEIFVLWLTLQPQGASEEVMVANNPFRIPPLRLKHKSYREPFALTRDSSRILQLENLYVGLMALEKYLQEQDQDVWPIKRLIGTIISPEEYKMYLKNLKIFTRRMRVPKRPEIQLRK